MLSYAWNYNEGSQAKTTLFFPSGKWKRHTPSLGEKAQTQLLPSRQSRHSDSSGQEATRCQEPPKGLVPNTDRGLALLACPSCYIRPSLMLSSTARRDQFSRKIAWARREEQTHWQSEKPAAANCRLLPGRGKGVVRSKEKLKFLCTPRVPLMRRAKLMPPPPRSFPATSQLHSRLTIQTEPPCSALVFFYPIQAGVASCDCCPSHAVPWPRTADTQLRDKMIKVGKVPFHSPRFEWPFSRFLKEKLQLQTIYFSSWLSS